MSNPAPRHSPKPLFSKGLNQHLRSRLQHLRHFPFVIRHSSFVIRHFSLASTFLLHPSSFASSLPPATATAERPLGNVRTLDFNDLRKLSASSVEDLFGNGLGLRWSSFSGDALGGPDLRGFGENASQRTLVLLDGRPLNRPDLGETDWSQIPVAQLETASVKRGAQTVRHGGAAAAGVIELKTRDPGAFPEGAAGAGGGSFGQRQADVWASHPAGDWRTLGAASLDRTGGWRDHSAESVGRAWAKVLTPGRGGVAWRLTAGATRQTTELPGGLASNGFPAAPRSSTALDAETRQSSLHASVAPFSEGGSGLSWEAPIHLEQKKLESDFDGIYADSSIGSALWQPVFRWADGVGEWEAGASLSRDTMDFTGWRERARRRPRNQAALERLNAGAFLLLRRDLGGGWTGSLGARWEGQRVVAENRPATGPGAYAGETAGAGPSFAAGLDWLGPRGRAWLEAATIRRFPVLDEIASYQGFPLSLPFNDALQPETGVSLETGAVFRPATGWETRAELFALWLGNEIAYDSVPNLNTNLARGERFSTELSLERSWETFRLGGRAGLVSARQTSGPYSGKDTYLVPAWTAGLFAVFTPVENLSLRWDTRWSGDAWEGNDSANTQPRLPGHSVSDARLSWSPAGRWQLGLQVRNVFDASYATKKYAGLWYPADARSLFASASLSF